MEETSLVETRQLLEVNNLIGFVIRLTARPQVAWRHPWLPIVIITKKTYT